MYKVVSICEAFFLMDLVKSRILLCSGNETITSRILVCLCFCFCLYTYKLIFCYECMCYERGLLLFLFYFFWLIFIIINTFMKEIIYMTSVVRHTIAFFVYLYSSTYFVNLFLKYVTVIIKYKKKFSTYIISETISLQRISFSFNLVNDYSW